MQQHRISNESFISQINMTAREECNKAMDSSEKIMDTVRSPKFIASSFLAAITISFAAGRYYEIIDLKLNGKAILEHGTYLSREEVENNYISKLEVSKYYYSRAKIAKDYVPISDHSKVIADLSDIQERLAMYNDFVKEDFRKLALGETWRSEKPSFLLYAGTLFGDPRAPSVELKTSFVDGGSSVSYLEGWGATRVWRFRDRGRLYELSATLKKNKDFIFVETAFTDKTKE